ncbi:MAG: universal stress protein [Phycisphaeraceae bacterium]
MIRRILLALGSEFYAETVIQRGIDLARRHGAQLTGVTVLDLEFWKGGWESVVTASEALRRVEERPWEAAQRRLDKFTRLFTQACESAGIEHRLIHPAADPLIRLAAEARHHDLLVFGLRGLFDHAIVPDPEATIAWLIRHDVSPVVAVGAEYREIRRVLIAYSGSAQSADAMKRFVQMRPWPDAEVQVVTFEEDPAGTDELLGAARDYCRAHGIEPELLRGRGSARQELLPLAKQRGADLLVLADSYRNLLLHKVLGDTTRDIIREADRPLFLTH